MKTSQIFALTKDDPHPKIGGDILGGQCYAHLLNRSFYFETSGSTTQGDFFYFFYFFFACMVAWEAVEVIIVCMK